METKALKKQLGAAIAMVLVAAIALGAATFAWFVNNNAVTATEVDVSTSSSVPNLYINSTGKTSGDMGKQTTNPTTLLPVSTNDGIHFYDTKHWTSAEGNGSHAFADQYKLATGTDGKTVYADYTFTLGVTNGSMKVYFDGTNYKTDKAVTTLKANDKMGTAGRFAIKFGDGKWMLFKVDGTPVTSGGIATGYYTDKVADSDKASGDYWVTGEGDKTKASTASYLTFEDYAGSIDGNGQAVPGTTPLTIIDSTVGDGTVAVTVRVWYEGCDKDCVSENAAAGIPNAIKGNLGFVGVQVK